MASTAARKEPASKREFKPVQNVPGRRHSIATPLPSTTAAAAGRRGSTTSQRKGSDPSSAINERHSSVSSNPETKRRGSVTDGMKGLFGRKKSVDEKPKPKILITSKHAAAARTSVLKAEQKTARKSSSTPAPTPAKGQEVAPHVSSHLSAQAQEERRPHSGPPALHGEMPMLTRIVSEDEEDSEDERSLHSYLADKKLLEEDGEPAAAAATSNETETHKPEPDHAEMDQIVEEEPVRRKSLLEVEIKGADRPRNYKKTVFGGWSRSEKGVWTRH